MGLFHLHKVDLKISLFHSIKEAKANCLDNDLQSEVLPPLWSTT